MTTNVANFLSKLEGGSIGAILVRGAGGAFTISLLSIAVSFISQVLLARFMGVKSFGVFTYIVTWITLLTLPSLLGLTTGSVRFISQYYAQEEWALLKGFLRINFIFPALAAILVGIITLCVVYFFGNFNSQDNNWNTWLFAVLFLLPFNVLVTVQASSLRGLKRAALAEAPTLLYSVGMLIIVAALSMFGTNLFTSTNVMLIRSIVTAIALFILMSFLRRSLPEQLATVEPAYQTKTWLRVSLPLLLIAGMSVVLKRTDIIMLGMFSGTTDAGVYAMASRIADFSLLSFAAVTAIAAPLISEYFSTNQQEKLQHVVRLSARGMFAVTALSCALIFMFPSQILRVFGAEFDAGSSALVILAIAHLANSFGGPVGQLLMMTGHQDDIAMILGGTVILNLCSNAALIPLHGMTGAAIATCISLMVATGISIWRVHHILGIRASAL